MSIVTVSITGEQKYISLWRHSDMCSPLICVAPHISFSRASGLGQELLLLWRYSDMCSPPEHRSLVKCVSSTREHISLRICVFWLRKHSSLGTGAHDYVRLISLISGVNPLSNRLNRTAGFELKGSYFRESRKSPWKKSGERRWNQEPFLPPFSFSPYAFFPDFTADGIWV